MAVQERFEALDVVIVDGALRENHDVDTVRGHFEHDRTAPMVTDTGWTAKCDLPLRDCSGQLLSGCIESVTRRVWPVDLLNDGAGVSGSGELLQLIGDWSELFEHRDDFRLRSGSFSR